MGRDDRIQFMTVTEPGKVDKGTFMSIKRSDILACPYAIMVPDHYRENGKCRCDDASHTEMNDWGYTWSKDTNSWTYRDLKGKKR